jgi:alpha-glucoside transport system substrate-binding protein
MAIFVVIAAVACSSGTASPAPASQAAATPAGSPAASLAPALPTTPTGYAELDQALANGADGKPTYNGKKVSIQTQWIGGEGANFAASVADFAKATGITIQIDSIGSSHETVLKTRIDGGQPPDLAVLAQPTGVLSYAADGKVIDVSTFMTGSFVNDHSATVGLVTDASGKIWGIPYKADVKSTVWYPIKAFAAAGYAVPKTWDELIALSDKIVADGKGNPWCIGIEAGTATGWQATDWVEEVMLKTQTPEVYNNWINGTLKFNSPEVKAAFDDVAKIFFTDKYVYGGNTAIVSTPQTQPMDPMFNGDTLTPGCWMQKIPTWYGPDFFPDVRAGGPGTVSKYKIGEDIGIFYFPTINEAQGTAAEGSADTLMVLTPADGGDARPETKAVAEFLSLPQGIQRWIEAGSAISANNTVPDAWYAGSYKLKVAADIVNNASYLGFDASDLMPPEVGAGSFWTESVNWINANGANTDQVLQNIDATWPAQ